MVVGVEARGFLLGAAVALVAGVGTVPVRKAGKLPAVAASRTYDLEYGTATLELPADVIEPGRASTSSTTCWRPAGRRPRHARCSPTPEPRSSASGRSWRSTALDGRARLDGVRVDALLSG